MFHSTTTIRVELGNICLYRNLVTIYGKLHFMLFIKYSKSSSKKSTNPYRCLE